jgi:hypothetical protein
VTKSIRAELRSVSEVFVGIGDPYLFGRFHVLISSWSEEIRKLTSSDTFDEHESLVGAGAAALLENFFAILLKPGVMDAFPHALACAPTGWLSKMLAGKAKVASAGSTMPICLFYMAGLLQVRKMGGDLFTCSNSSGGKYCHQGPTCRFCHRFHGWKQK